MPPVHLRSPHAGIAGLALARPAARSGHRATRDRKGRRRRTRRSRRRARAVAGARRRDRTPREHDAPGSDRPARERARRLRQVPVPRGGRRALRGRAHPAPPPAVFRVRLLAGRLRARVRLLRDGTLGPHAQSRAVGDRRAGPGREARGRPTGPSPGVVFQGQGEPLAELRRGDPRGRDPARSVGAQDPRRGDHDLDRGPSSRDRALHARAARLSADPLVDLGDRREARVARPARGKVLRRRARRARCAGTPKRTADRCTWGGFSCPASIPERTRPRRSRERSRALPCASTSSTSTIRRGATGRRDDAERGRFLDALRARGIAFVRRYSGGPDIHAACGMLASTARGGRPG